MHDATAGADSPALQKLAEKEERGDWVQHHVFDVSPCHRSVNPGVQSPDKRVENLTRRFPPGVQKVCLEAGGTRCRFQKFWALFS